MKWLIGLAVGNLLVLNGVIGWLVYKSQSQNSKDQINTNIQTSQTKTEYVDRCGTECQKYIDESLKSQIQSSKALPTPSSTVVYKTTPKAKVRSVQYVTIPGSGFTLSNDWTGISGTDFYFNTADYPGLVEIYLEGNMRLLNGNGKAYGRLFDATHNIGVQGSELETTNQTTTVVTSGKVTFWSGKNLIRVQLKSLTADTSILDSARLRIVVDN